MSYCSFGHVYLCGAFWSAPTTGTDSKGGTLIHEVGLIAQRDIQLIANMTHTHTELTLQHGVAAPSLV